MNNNDDQRDTTNNLIKTTSDGGEKVIEERAEFSEDELFMQKLKALFCKENATLIDGIKNALKKGDVVEAHRLAHTLKSSAALIGKPNLSQLAAQVESQLTDNKNLLNDNSLQLMKSELDLVLAEFANLDGASEQDVPPSVESVAKNSILIVEDDRVNSLALEFLLGEDYKIYTAENGTSALSMAKKFLPDLIMLDIVLPDIDGYEVLYELRMEHETKDIPIIFLTGISTSDGEKKALKLTGVADYISKPFDNEIVKLRVSNQIKRINDMRTIESLSNVDALTGIPNRRSFSSRLDAEWGRAVRHGNQLSLVIADIDNFKRYNDTHGHLQGDEALKVVAKVLSASIMRKTDMVARWGGEEFIALLPDTELEDALSVAEKIRMSVEDTDIFDANGDSHNITLSLGVNTVALSHNGDIGDIDKFVGGADEALYRAKRKGKNMVVAHDS